MAGTAMESALNFLSRKAYTTAEIRERLSKKGFKDEEIAYTLQRLQEWGYLDDTVYATNYCLNFLPRESRQKVYYALLRKGIDTSVIDRVIEKVYSLEQERILCMQHAKKLWDYEDHKWNKNYQFKTSYQGFSRHYILKKKVGAKLWQKGFNSELIDECLRYLEESE